MTSDRKRKRSNSDDDMSVNCRSQSSSDIDRCELMKSIRPADFTVERPIAVHMSGAVIASTLSSGAAALQTFWSPPAHSRDNTHGQRQVRDLRPPATHREYRDNGDKLYALPFGVVDVWNKNWTSPSSPRLIIEPTLCRESVLPVLLLSGSSCCQLSN